jgi:hypothetical protein
MDENQGLVIFGWGETIVRTSLFSFSVKQAQACA